MRRTIHNAGMVGFGVLVVVAAEVGTVLLVGVVHELEASRAQVSALQHRPSRVVVTVTPTPGTAGSAPRSPLPAVSGSLTVVAADRPGTSGGSSGSGTSGGGAAPAPGPTTPPQTPPPSPPASQPPRQATCSTVRVTAQKPPLGVWACATVQATAKTGSPVNGTR